MPHRQREICEIVEFEKLQDISHRVAIERSANLTVGIQRLEPDI